MTFLFLLYVFILLRLAYLASRPLHADILATFRDMREEFRSTWALLNGKEYTPRYDSQP